ncbi:unnamed protein product [Closterium sp. Naga37s-1]|nr:unnamed protein product [Closterium sp. Naga37s-1]
MASPRGRGSGSNLEDAARQLSSIIAASSLSLPPPLTPPSSHFLRLSLPPPLTSSASYFLRLSLPPPFNVSSSCCDHILSPRFPLALPFPPLLPFPSPLPPFPSPLHFAPTLFLLFLGPPPPPLLSSHPALVDDFVRSGMVVGVGSGFGSSLAVTHLISKIESGSLRDIIAVPTSLTLEAPSRPNFPRLKRSLTCALSHHFLFTQQLKQNSKFDFAFTDADVLDFAFTDADVVQEGTLFSIIGRRIPTKRGSVLKEKAVARAAETFAVIVPEKHFEEGLIDGEVPVEIEQEHWLDIAEEIDDLFLGDAEVWRRPTSGTAGPLGGEFPLVTEGGHFVLDVIFTTPIADMGCCSPVRLNVAGGVKNLMQ